MRILEQILTKIILKLSTKTGTKMISGTIYYNSTQIFGLYKTTQCYDF